MPETPPHADIPEAAVGQSRWSLFLIWLIPVIVVVIGAWLAAKTIVEQGSMITIKFNTAEGLEAGKTKIKYKNVDIGEVKNITLSHDRATVIVYAQMTKEAENFLVKDTRFWIVRPRVAGGNISGLGTLLSGAYIGVDPGKSAEETEYFVGLETPPAVTQDRLGKQFVLHGNSLGSLDIGSPIYFRRVEVGQVIAFQLDKSGGGVTLQIFVNAPYDQFVKTNSQFWQASGLDFSADANGFRLDTESLATIVIAGIEFQSPPTDSTGSPAPANKAFRLAADRTQAMKVPDIAGETFMMTFRESVRGLSPGAPIDFHGIVIGEVESLQLDYDPSQKLFNIPVKIRLYRDPLFTKYRNNGEPLDTKHILDRLVERGFRGQLRTGNLLTQQLYIAMDFFADAPKTKIDWSKGPPVLPTLPGPFEELQATVSRIFKKLDKVPLDAISGDLRRTLQSLDGTVRRADKLINRVDTEVVPEVRSTLEGTRKALGSVESTLAVDAPLQQDAREALRELGQAAQSLRTLTDYLERHPEAILRGKKKEEETQ
ncbi:MAG: MlaD family protein [Pseudomonadota bacterium]